MTMEMDLIDWKGFVHALKQQVLDAEQRGGVFALIAIQVRQLPLYNFRLGFEGGEAIVGEIAARASGTLKKVAAMARIAPDKIGIIVRDIGMPELLPVSAQKVIDSLARPFILEGQPVALEASIAISIFPQHGSTAEALMSEVELSLGRTLERTSSYHIPAKTSSERYLSLLQIQNDLQSAIAFGNLSLNYQPKLDLQTLEPIASEALVRWVTDSGKVITPEQFIHVAEVSGDINRLTEWAINAALREGSQLTREGREYAVGVNISAPSIYHPSFVVMVQNALAIWDLSPQSLTLEITETILMKNPETCFKTLSSLRDMGVKISIDDFGTGFSSLSYFKKIPADEIKIDQSFVKAICENPDDEKIVASIVDLSHKFGLVVVGEGIESRDILDKLREMGCDIGQGYYLARPMGIDTYQRWLENFNVSQLNDSQLNVSRLNAS